MSNEAEIAKLVGAMGASFPSANVTDATIEVYISMLKDIPLEVLTASVEQCMAESEFFPTIAKLRNKALALVAPPRKDPMAAWGEVIRQIQRTGFYRSPHFEDPLIAKAVDCLGWQYLCSSENIVADRAHFAKAYEQFVEREAQDARLLPAARRLQEMSQVREIGDGRSF
jgi:hypothetical protein